jgi:integral membrane protein
MELLRTHIGRFRIIGILEGISFILLMGVGMPLKYYGGYPHATQDIGMAHGVLFIAYVISVFPVRKELKWSNQTTFLVLLASVIPFGTFIAEYKLFHKKKVQPETV